MKLCAGQCRYLITLYRLSCEHNIVRSVDIANALSVTRPSVSRMLKCMERLEFIHPDFSTSVKMTQKGRETAERLSENFNDVKDFFMNILKIDEKLAFDQSIDFLSTFPEHTIERLATVTRTTIKKRNKK